MSHAEGLTIRTERVEKRLAIGGPALFIDDGRMERVKVLSDVYPHPESGEAMRVCAFLSEAGAEYEVKADCLATCNADWSISQPPDLVTPRHRGVESVERDGGRVYAPDPIPQRSTRQHPVMEKFDRIAAIDPEAAILSVGALSPSRAARIANAERLAANRDPLQRAKGRLEMEALQREVQSETEVEAVMRGLNETAAQARMRGDFVAPEDVEGRIVLRSRDGLESLTKAGSLNPIQYDALCLYRIVFEATETSLRSCMGDRSGGGGSGFDMKAQNWGAETMKRKAIEAKVQAASRNGLGLKTLRLVAGEGRTINSITKGGADRANHVAALLIAADVVADYFGMH